MQSERRAKNKFPHRLSKKGYGGLNEELKKTLGEKYKDDRSFLWTKAREIKNGEYVDDDTKEVAEKVEALRKQVEDGSLVIEGSSDILTLALGTPEHSGRVRGLGLGVIPTNYFKLPRRGSKSHNKELESQLEAERKRRKELEQILKEVEAQGNLPTQIRISQSSEKVESNTKKSSNRKYATLVASQHRSSGSKTFSHCSKLKGNETTSIQKDVSSPVLSIGMGKKCKLAFGIKDNIVADGMVFDNDGADMKIHTIALGEHNVRVSITKAISPNANLPVPVRGEMETVKEAVGSIVAWPKEFVLSVVEEENIDDYGHIQAEKNDDTNCSIIDAFSDIVETIEGNTIRIPTEKEMFGGDVECYLSKKSLMDLCTMSPLDVNFITAYMRLLYDKFKSSRELVQFFNPSTINTASK